MKKQLLGLIIGVMVLATACNADNTATTDESGSAEASTEGSSSVDLFTNLENHESTTDISINTATYPENELLEEIKSTYDGTMPAQEDLDKLADSAITPSEDLFTGKWQRTDCVSGDFATVNINLNDEGIASVSGFFYDYGNIGSIKDGTGYYLSDNVMYVVDSDNNAVYLMEIQAGSMEIVQLGEGNMGQDVTANGNYTLGEPEYTNANVIEDNFTDEQLSSIQTMIEDAGLDYVEFFENTILYGILNVSEKTATFSDGTVQTGTCYEAVSPHGFTYDSTTFIAEDGEIYFISTAEGISEYYFLTTNDAVTDMPTLE